jgi:hypothetical protein
MEIMGTEEGAVDFDPKQDEERKVQEMVREWQMCDKEKNTGQLKLS